MSLKEIRYSVLVVSSSEKFNQNLGSHLPSSRFDPVTVAGSTDEARRIILDRRQDIVLINTPLPDDFGLHLAADLAHDGSCGVLLFVKSDLYDEISAKLFGTGILILPKPTSGILVAQSLQLLCASKEKLQRLEHRNATLEEKMEEIRLVNRAKWILISELKMTESEAHRYVEKSAMDLCLTKKEIAGRIIKTYQS